MQVAIALSYPMNKLTLVAQIVLVIKHTILCRVFLYNIIHHTLSVWLSNLVNFSFVDKLYDFPYSTF